jgi:single stranded DNA-binding protein
VSVNEVRILGRIGHDIELEHLGEEQIAHTRVRIATDRWWKGQRTTHWIPVHFWREQAEKVARYCGKGQRIYVAGHLNMATWEDNGAPRARLEVFGDRVVFLDGPNRVVGDTAAPATL